MVFTNCGLSKLELLSTLFPNSVIVSYPWRGKLSVAHWMPGKRKKQLRENLPSQHLWHCFTCLLHEQSEHSGQKNTCIDYFLHIFKCTTAPIHCSSSCFNPQKKSIFGPHARALPTHENRKLFISILSQLLLLDSRRAGSWSSRT